MKINLYFAKEVNISNALKSVLHILKLNERIFLKVKTTNLRVQIIIKIFIFFFTLRSVREILSPKLLRREIYILIRNNAVLSGIKKNLDFFYNVKDIALMYGDSVVKYGEVIWYEARPKYSADLAMQHDYFGDVLVSNFEIEYNFLFSELIFNAKKNGIEIINCTQSMSHRNSKKIDIFGTPILIDKSYSELKNSKALQSLEIVDCLTIVIPTKFQSDGTYNILNCIKSVISIAGEFKLEFIIVYHEDYRNKFKKLKSDLNLLGFDPNSLISKMYNEVFNFSKAINLGVSEASNNIILILNDDVLIKNDSDLDHLVSHFISSTQNGVAGVRLINQDHELIHAGVELTAQGPRHFLQKSPFDFMPASHNFCREMSAVTGALMMFKKEVFFEVGGFDERFPNDYNDIEFSIRLNKIGLKVLMCAGLIGYHRESLSRGLTPNLEIQNSYKQLTKLVGMFPDRDNFLYTPATRLQISKSQQL